MKIYLSMKNLLFLIFAVGFLSVAQAQKIRLKVNGQPDTVVHLIKYFGKGLYYADTAQMKGGEVVFNGAKQKPGILGLLLPGQKYFEFVYNNEEIWIETSGPNFNENLLVKKSEENKIFAPYVNYITKQKTEAARLGDERNKAAVNDPVYKELSARIDKLNNDVIAYQKNIIANHSDKLVGKVVRMSLDVDIPTAPRDDKGNKLDSNFEFKYYRTHYWDNVDLQDDRIVNNPIFHNKLETYFSKNMMIQHWDTVLFYAFDFCDRLNPKSRMYEYCVGWITSTFGKSQIMGMDKVYYHMLKRYYCTKNSEGKYPAFWVETSKFEDLCKDLDMHLSLCLGEVAPNLILRDSTDLNYVNLHGLKAEYTILYFWDPECGHCKKITPKLGVLYNQKLKSRNVEIYSVGKAIGKDFESWKKFIRDNKLEFYNVAVTEKLYQIAKDNPESLVPIYPGEKGKPTTLESLNYQTTYDIFSTPKVFVLDKDKRIIAKSLSISQLEDMLDKMQNVKDAPKLFPPDKEEDEQMQKKE